MSVDPTTLLAILLMAAGTYGVRAGGYFLIQRLAPSPFLEAWMRHVPGAMFVALVLPAILKGGLPFAAGAIAVLLAARLKGNLILSLVLGVAAVAAARAF
jgi:uncharacterized membrane protein